MRSTWPRTPTRCSSCGWSCGLFDSRLANLLLTGRRGAGSGGSTWPVGERYLLGWATSRAPPAAGGVPGPSSGCSRSSPTRIPERRPRTRGSPRSATSTGPSRSPPTRRRSCPSTSGTSPPRRPVTAPSSSRPTSSSWAPGPAEAWWRPTSPGAAGPWSCSRPGRSCREPEMPTDEITAFDRLYLDHGLNVVLGRIDPTLAGRRRRGRHPRQLDDVHRPARAASARAGPPTTASTGSTAPGGRRGHRARSRRELGVREPPDVPAKDAADPARAAALGGEASETRRDGVDCGDCGRCGFGCRRGAKQSGIRVHLAEAWRNGARIVPDAPVERVLIEDGRAVGVEAVDRSRRRPAPAGRAIAEVVVAAGTLRTPVVLLRSGIDHPAIGRHLRLHPVSVLGAFLDDDVTMWRGTTQAARSLEHLASGADAGRRRVHRSSRRPGTPGLIGLAVPVGVAGAFRSLMRRDPPRGAADRDHRAIAVAGGSRISRAGRPRIDYRRGARGSPALQDGLASAARIAWEGGSRRMVAARHAGGLVRRRTAPPASEPPSRPTWRGLARLRLPAQPRDGRLGAPDGLGPGGRASGRLPVRPVGPGADGRCAAGRDATIRGPVRRRRARCSRPRSASTR